MRKSNLLTILSVATLFLAGASLVLGQESGATSCEICHRDADLFDEAGLVPVTQHQGSVHAGVGISCHDCHGGNPDPALADDMFASMDEEWSESPYVGVPAPRDVPGLCGGCHSDPTYMRQFNPDPRVDQETEYWTSGHGIALEAGDVRVATCVDCHGNHGTLPVDDASSQVYPTNVAETCSGCHSNADLMAGSTTERGQPLPVNQFALWQQSVHAKAMTEKGDLSAPTCNDCHGNHGAMPPGLTSVAFVCGNCHGREAELFRNSPKYDLQTAHAEYLADAGEEGCVACHDESSAKATVGVTSFGECDVCHGHHGIVRPSVAMLSPLPETPCAFCHQPPDGLESEVLGGEASARRYEEKLEELLAELPEGDRDSRFDALVDRSLEIPTHLQAGGTEPTAEFDRLFNKFRIGKTHYTYVDPVTGEERSRTVVRCSHCHEAEPMLTDDPVGYRTSQALLDRTQQLTQQGAAAERLMLRARRGGVEVRQAESAIDGVVDAQIELQTLVHGFTVAEDSEFVETQSEGMEAASTAIQAAREALEELRFRWTGLAVSLVFILLVLIALALLIRSLPSEVREIEET